MNNSKVVAFFGDPRIKQDCIARVQVDVAAWETEQGRSSFDYLLKPLDVGLPQWLGYYAITWPVRLVEALPVGMTESQLESLRHIMTTWPVRLVEALPVGMTESQLQAVRHDIAIDRLQKLSADQQAAIGDCWGVAAAIYLAIAYHRAPTQAAWRAANVATRKAVDEARFVAKRARSEWSAWSASLAAESAWASMWSQWSEQAWPQAEAASANFADLSRCSWSEDEAARWARSVAQIEQEGHVLLASIKAHAERQLR
jgi:hypothetical protein